MNKTIAIFIIIAVLVAGVAFYGGMIYGKSTVGAGSPNSRNLTQQQRQQLGGNRTGRNNANGGFISGQVIAKDDKSVTVQLTDGSGSKIIFLSPTTEIMKTATGTPNDLQIDQNLTVSGQANPDGSITGQSIQIRPNLPARATSTPAN